MTRRRSMLLALFVLVALVVPQTPSYAVAKGDIKGVSHYHPDNSDFSWVGARIRATPHARVVARLLMGGTVVGRVTCRSVPDSAEVLAVWKITSAGDYVVKAKVIKGGDTDKTSESYTVPNPPPPESNREGPFAFKHAAGCFKGWPES